MKKQSNPKNERSIELRSEKVRNIVGQIPPFLLRQGTVIIALVIMIMIAVSAFIPYRKTIAVDIELTSNPKMEVIHASHTGIFLSDSLQENVKRNQNLACIVENNKIFDIKTAFSGKLLPNVCNNDSVMAGDILFIVVPNNVSQITGTSYVNISEKNMLKTSNIVQVADASGKMIKGKIVRILPVENAKKQYRIKILFSATDVNISSTKMHGQIILKESSILRHFTNSLRI